MMQHDDYQSFIDSAHYDASGSVPPMSHPSPQRTAQGQLPHYLNNQHHDDHENDHLPLIYEQPVSDCGDTDTTLMHDPNDFTSFYMNNSTFPPLMPQPVPNTIDPSILSSGSPSSGHSFPNSHSPHYQMPMLPDPSGPSSSPRKEPLSPLNLAALTGSLPNGHHSSPHLTTPHSSHSGGAETPSGSSCGGSEIWETSSQNDYLQDGELLSPDEARGLGLGRSSSDSKVYRRNIEKKSRDKKTKAFEKLKKQLHLSTTKSFDSRSQYEVFEASARALAEHRAKEQQLLAEVQMLRQQLVNQQQLAGYSMQN